MGKMEVIDPGLFTTIQDAGRTGYRNTGIPESGVMDIRSYRNANYLAGNADDAPVLELTLIGGTYQFQNDTMIAITGAYMDPKRNGVAIPMNRTISIRSGDKISFDRAKRGCRSYLAIRGTLDADHIMGSSSTYTPGKFGGFGGRAIKKSDLISWKDPSDSGEIRELPKNDVPYFSSKVTVACYRGPEWEWLSEDEQMKFTETEFKVSPGSNRMGIRLEGESLKSPDREMISSPVIPGIIQLPGVGNPIILHKDGQTIGGYPRIVKVLDSELWRLGQVKAGDRIRFELQDPIF